LKGSPLKSTYIGKEKLQNELQKVLDGYINQGVTKGLIIVKGTFGIGKSLTMHVAINSLITRIDGG
jgi:type II secretory ATPase GspE/PulE/Tfp pilus assembly ATPase PilB-like protein